MKYLIGKFIGPQKIKEVRLSDRKTYAGRDVIELTYEDEMKEELPKEILEKIVSLEATDLTTLRDNFVKPVVERMIAVLLESEIKIVDIEYALAKTSNSLNVHLETASEILWKKDLMKRTLADIQTIITQKNELQKNNQKLEGRRSPKIIPDKKGDRKTPKEKKS